MSQEVIGFYIDKANCISSSKERNKSVQSSTAILYWLVSFANSLNIFYDINLAVSSVLSKCNLTIEQIQTLFDTTKLQIGQISITYITDKYFSVKVGQNYEAPYAGFSDASQYFVAELENDTSINYAFKCACKARDTGIEVCKGLSLLGISSPTSLISPINQFQRKWGKHPNFQFPTIDDLNEIDENIGAYFWESTMGGWFEAFRRGHFISGVFDYDIKSCYSSLLCTIPDTRLGVFKHVTEMTDAPIGVYNCNIDINAKFSPISYRRKEKNFTANGVQKNKKLVKMSIENILDYDLGEVEIIDGYEWTPIEWKPIYAPLMKRLYDLKEQNEGIPKDIIKRVSNAEWGITGAVIRSKTRGDKFGEYANPLVYALVEAHARSKVFRTCMDNNIIPINIQMDGFSTDTELTKIALGDGLGEWKCAHSNVSALAINADLILLEGKSNHAIFGVEYDWMKNEIEKDPDNHIYSMTRNSCVTVGKVVNNPKLLPQLGEIIPTTRSVDITADTKRLWADSPQTGTELLSGKIYDSLPLSVEMIDLMHLEDTDDLLTNIE